MKQTLAVILLSLVTLLSSIHCVTPSLVSSDEAAVTIASDRSLLRKKQGSMGNDGGELDLESGNHKNRLLQDQQQNQQQMTQEEIDQQNQQQQQKENVPLQQDQGQNQMNNTNENQQQQNEEQGQPQGGQQPNESDASTNLNNKSNLPLLILVCAALFALYMLRKRFIENRNLNNNYQYHGITRGVVNSSFYRSASGSSSGGGVGNSGGVVDVDEYDDDHYDDDDNFTYGVSVSSEKNGMQLGSKSSFKNSHSRGQQEM